MRRLLATPAPGNLFALFALLVISLSAAGIFLLPEREPSLDRAEQHWHRQEFRHARTLALQWLNRNPHDSDAWCMVVASYVVDRSEPDENLWDPVRGTATQTRFHSLFAYSLGLSLSPHARVPQSPELLRDLGCVLDRLDQSVAALDHYRAAEKLEPDLESRHHILSLERRLGWKQDFRQHMRDPEFFAASDPWLRMHFYAAEGMPGPMLLDSARAQWAAYDADTLVPAIIVGACWLIMALHMCGFSDWKKLWYVPFALILGVLSTYPTLALVLVQENAFPYETSQKQWLISLLYAVLGIGLREETMKLLLAMPLLFAVRRYAGIHALTAAALVGLGFAVEENTQYYADGGAAVMGRFLTANFAHMAWTGLAGLAFVEGLNDERKWGLFLETFCLVVASHGLYDFFIIEPSMGSVIFLSSIVFILLAQKYFARVSSITPRVRRRIPLVTLFTAVLAVSCSTAYVMLARETHYLHAIAGTAGSLVGIVFISIIFYREFWAQEMGK